MQNLLRKTLIHTICTAHLFKLCRQVFTFCGVFCALHLLLWTAFGYESQFTDNTKKIRLRWRSDVISLTFSNSLRQPSTNIKPNSDVAGAVKNSLKTWEATANIKFATVWSDKTSISQLGTPGDGISLITIADTAENVLPFQNELAELPGITRTFYNRRGDITESDVVLNPYQQFSTDGSFGTFDLEAALTHEIGHLLGLDHSTVLAATMYSQQGKNGTFSLSAFAPRTLAEDDRAGIRLLYGAKINESYCCGAVGGSLTNFDGKQLAGWQIWAEEATTGRLFATVLTNNNGIWSIASLPSGKYQIFTQAEKSNAETLGTVIVEVDRNTLLNRRIETQRRLFDSLLLGYNGQLSALAIPLDPGRWQNILLGSRNLSIESPKLGVAVNSPYLKVSSEILTKQDFDAPFTVASFDLHVDSDSPPGEYNLQIQNSSGEKVYLLGCLTVEKN